MIFLVKLPMDNFTISLTVDLLKKPRVYYDCYYYNCFLDKEDVYMADPSIIIEVIWAAHNGRNTIEKGWTKTEAGILVSRKFINKFISRYGNSFVKQLYIEHNVNLFGNCQECSTCPPTNIFLGKAFCHQKIILTIMRLNRVLLPELTREICKMLLP